MMEYKLRWRMSSMTSLKHAYKKPSANKVKAWRYCEEMCRKYNGKNLKVISYNVFKFTAGFEFVDQETGVVKFMLITPTYDKVEDM